MGLASAQELSIKKPIIDPAVIKTLANWFESDSAVACVAYQDETLAIDESKKDALDDWLLQANDLKSLTNTHVSWNVVACPKKVLVEEFERARQLYDVASRQLARNQDVNREGVSHELHALISEFFAMNATDIHVSLKGDQALMYPRIGGVCSVVPKRMDRTPMMAMIAAAFNWDGSEHSNDNLNEDHTGETKLPDVRVADKDGNIHFVEVRLQYRSLVKGRDGNKVCAFRIQKHGQVKRVDDLGLSLHTATTFKFIMQSSDGLVIITGPTGAGKSTTMHALLSEKPTTSVVHTIEDPIEQVSEDPLVFQGSAISDGDQTKEIVRLDPDIVVQGEMRNSETVQQCVGLSRTGHLVLTTYHANSSLAAIDRMVEHGVSYSQLAQENLLKCVTAQRLVPKTCQKCGKKVSPYNPSSSRGKYHKMWENWRSVASDSAFDKLARLARDKKLRVIDPEGCSACNFLGRTDERQLIVEYVYIDEKAREFISQGDMKGLKDYIKSNGWQSMQDIAWKFVEEGVLDPMMVESKLSNFIMTSQTHRYDS